MSKIVQAVNAMISNSKFITEVTRGNDEIFFLYKRKYRWSMARRDDEHVLWFYPGDESVRSLASRDGNWDDVEMVVYKDSEIGTREARASFTELYSLLTEKVYGVDEVLDDIIADDDI